MPWFFKKDYLKKKIELARSVISDANGMVWEKIQADFSVELFEMQSSLALVLGCFLCISWQGLRCRGRFLKGAKMGQSKGSLRGLKRERREVKPRAHAGTVRVEALAVIYPGGLLRKVEGLSPEWSR